MGSRVLCGFSLHIHALHLDLVDFKRTGIALTQPLLKKYQQFVSILPAFLQQKAFLVQSDQVQTEILGPQQDILPQKPVLAVNNFLLQLARTAACHITGRELKSLLDHQFGTGHSGHTVGIERTVFHTRIFQVVLRPHFHFTGLGRILSGLQFLVVLFHGTKHRFDRLGMQGRSCQNASQCQYPIYFLDVHNLAI